VRQKINHSPKRGSINVRTKGGSNAQPRIAPEPALRLFCSYSHKDEDLRNQLERHLKLLQHRGVITSWCDRLIEAGQDWKGLISENLERADLILLLVSADFIASDYCYNIEMTRALERHKAGEAWVIPVILRDVDWSDAPFGKLQALPKNGKAVRRWPDRDAAWCNVVEGIKAAAVELQRRKLS
jgi:internalin A